MRAAGGIETAPQHEERAMRCEPRARGAFDGVRGAEPDKAVRGRQWAQNQCRGHPPDVHSLREQRLQTRMWAGLLARTRTVRLLLGGGRERAVLLD